LEKSLANRAGFPYRCTFGFVTLFLFLGTMLTTPPSLLARLRGSPEREAWERFVEMYTPLFFTWAKRLSLNDHEAADLVQDLFTVLVEQLPHFVYDPHKSFRAWLKTILLNRRRNRMRRLSVEKVVDHPNLNEVAGQDEPILELEETEYRKYLVGRALALMQAEFQPPTWKACWEFVVCGRSADEVAKQLGISVNAVYLAKSRVLRRLREELAGLLD
jgi:RNA polymerase sigma-70 factor (ECF subfamily)